MSANVFVSAGASVILIGNDLIGWSASISAAGAYLPYSSANIPLINGTEICIKIPPYKTIIIDPNLNTIFVNLLFR